MGLPSRLGYERAKNLRVFVGAHSEISDSRLVALPARSPSATPTATSWVPLECQAMSLNYEVRAAAGVTAADLEADVGQNPQWRGPTICPVPENVSRSPPGHLGLYIMHEVPISPRLNFGAYQDFDHLGILEPVFAFLKELDVSDNP